MEHRIERWVVNAMRVYHLNVRPTFQRQSPRTVMRAFQRDDDGVEEVATEHFFVTSKGNANFNPRSIAEEFMDKVKIEPLGALRPSML